MEYDIGFYLCLCHMTFLFQLWSSKNDLQHLQCTSSVVESDLQADFAGFFSKSWLFDQLSVFYIGATKHIRSGQNVLSILKKGKKIEMRL